MSLITQDDVVPGAVFKVWWPFMSHQREDDRLAWTVGWQQEFYDEIAYYWQGEGAQIRTVVSLHRPAPQYEVRVFFQRHWQHPDGLEPPRRSLHVETLTRFLKFANGRSLAFLEGNRGDNELIATIWEGQP